MISVFGDTPSIVSQCLHELRDQHIQKDRPRFERNVEKLGVFLGYELSKQLTYRDHPTKTPLGTANTPLLEDKLVLCTVLRAGLPLQHGIHTVFPDAALAFIGAARKPETGGEVEIDLSYVASPELTGRVLILADTMLATGKSLVDAYNALVAKHGTPDKTYVVAVIASKAGIDYVAEHIKESELLVAAVDAELNDKFYIVPGLGDAGDLLYGEKQ